MLAYTGAAIFDGAGMRRGHALCVEAGQMTALLPETALPEGARCERLPGGVLAPGLVDLQVNGGGGVMLNDAPTIEGLRRIAEAHARLGATTILPTLISDRPEVTRAALAAARQAVRLGLPGIGGLHLEGPHLAPSRAGAHDPARLRPMTAEDLEALCAAAADLPALMVTVAPEAVTAEQVAALAAAGAVVSLGHSAAGFEECMALVRAGARCVTHLFNAMNPLSARAPGLTGAALDSGALHAGLIADGLHVHPATLALALRAKAGPGRLFLVSDAMAVAGTALDGFVLNGREIRREAGRLTLADGTLAGADLDLPRAIAVLIGQAGAAPETALAMAGSIPADLVGLSAGRLVPGAPADMVLLAGDWSLRAVWRAGERLSRT
ncbi:MAG: N-acetylglucosamine-6-phosphate deacetylase [Paracoccaceae bacterium]